MRRIWQLSLAVGLGLAAWFVLWFGVSRPTAVTAQGSITWPDVSLSLYATGLNQAVHITHAGDGTGRMFTVERGGLIRIVKGGALLGTPFLDIAGQVGDENNEQGLLSLAFPPDYASQGIFYVYYTDNSGDSVVARYRVTSDPDVADPGSEEIILTIDQPYKNHNGGQLAFGPNDSYLYIGTGDGGSAGDPENRAQDPSSLLGKLLRIDVEPTQAISAEHSVYLPILFTGKGPTDVQGAYRIPPDNPYTQTPGYRGEIWALGLRNPWRFSFDRVTGDLYTGDVGQNSYEEVDYQAAASPGGENYGWRIMEGLHCYNAESCDMTGLVLPVAEYDHSQGCSVTGGLVYRGGDYAGMQGVYFYADYCSGRLWGLKHDGVAWQSALLLETGHSVASFGEDEAGNLYLSDYFNGDIYKIEEQP
jgi:glucose/arabinose dehydrogenase